MLSVEEARQQMLNTIPVLPTEKREILNCGGYVLAEALHAQENIPPFDNSAMDGYAVRAVDVQNASEAEPAVLTIVETIAAGYAPTKQVAAGQAARMMRGALRPEGAGEDVMQEVTQREETTVKICESIDETGNSRCTGEGVATGQQVRGKGKHLRPPEVSMIAALNRPEATVHRKPTVAIVSTGDELLLLGESLEPGKIRESNRYGLYAQVEEAGGIPIDMGIAPDDEAEIERIFRAALAKADALITSGGVSVGEHDFVKSVLERLGEVNFWRVAMKPGKPQAYGISDGKPIFGLPGNPVSSLVVFELFVRPALLKMAGHTELLRPTFKATLEESITNRDGRVNYMRAILKESNGHYTAETTGPQGSGILHSLVLANGLITIPAGVTLSAGETVDAQFLF